MAMTLKCIFIAACIAYTQADIYLHNPRYVVSNIMHVVGAIQNGSMPQREVNLIIYSDHYLAM